MRGFWNDPDGISITDFLALLFSTAYLALLGLLVYRMATDTLTTMDVDLLQIFTWTILTILGGYFGGQMLQRLGSTRQGPMPNNQYGMYGGMYGGYGGGMGGYGYGMGMPINMLDPALAAQPVVTSTDVPNPADNEGAEQRG